MDSYLTWKIETNLEGNGPNEAISYKWCRFVEDDITARGVLHRRLEELHKQTYVSQEE